MLLKPYARRSPVALSCFRPIVRHLALLTLFALTSCGEPEDRLADWGAQLHFETAQNPGLTFAVPPPWPVTNAEQFSARQHRVRQALLDTFGFDSTATTDTNILERERLEAPNSLHRERLVFTGHDGTPIPAILQYPEQSQHGAAILVIPGHTPASDSGLRQLVTDDDSYQHAAATRLAAAGFTTLAFELRGFGLLGAPLGTEHVHVAFNALQAGSFYKALVTADARAALAVLRQVPHVDESRIGVTGASLGGEIAVTLAALDPHIRAVAWSSYGGRSGPLAIAAGTRAQQRHYCHVIPGAARFLRREDDILLLAPRPALGLRGEQDHRPDADFLALGRASWALLGAAGEFAFESIPGRGHEFFVDETIAFFAAHLAAP